MKFPFIISLPHCSKQVPEEVRPALALNNKEIWESTDRGTKEIFGSIPAKKIIFARWSRLVVDLNRSPTRQSAKGVIPQVDYHGRFIYRSGCIPDENERKRRLREYYWPFHKRLVEAFEETDSKVLFDCHSLNGTGPEAAPDFGKKRKDIILGNNGDHSGNMNPARGRITCPVETLQLMKEAFQRAGYSVSLNDPYPGGFITNYYGKKFASAGKIVVQIEINQDLYVEHTRKRLSPKKLEKVKTRVLQSFREIARKL
jgi:N-formylglutamate amidohydrolase